MPFGTTLVTLTPSFRSYTRVMLKRGLFYLVYREKPRRVQQQSRSIRNDKRILLVCVNQIRLFDSLAARRPPPPSPVVILFDFTSQLALKTRGSSILELSTCLCYVVLFFFFFYQIHYGVKHFTGARQAAEFILGITEQSRHY